MAFDNKALEAVDESDLQSLITDGVAEGKAIEYKQELPGNDYEAVREFLSDVSSFANAAGGHLIFGVREDGGLPVEICGLQNIDVDRVKQRLENSILDNMEPRLPGISVQEIPLQSGNVVIIIRISRSWALPHVVKFQRHWRFYSRNSAGKYPLDVAELRAAFGLSETMADRIKSFRNERLSMIVSGETPAPIGEGAKIVLHVIPFGAFDPAARFDVSLLANRRELLGPIGASGWTPRYNFDGILTYERLPNEASVEAYLQVFRNGSVEAVDTYLLGRQRDSESPLIPSLSYEQEILSALPRFLSIQQLLGVEPPVFIMLSLLGVAGYTMGVSSRYIIRERHPIEKNTLVLPDVLVESVDSDIAEVMRPVFDTVWNAAGWARSMNYNDEGNWAPQR